MTLLTDPSLVLRVQSQSTNKCPGANTISRTEGNWRETRISSCYPVSPNRERPCFRDPDYNASTNLKGAKRSRKNGLTRTDNSGDHPKSLRGWTKYLRVDLAPIKVIGLFLRPSYPLKQIFTGVGSLGTEH